MELAGGMNASELLTAARDSSESFCIFACMLAPSISWYKTPASTKTPRMIARTSENKCRMVYIRMLTANNAELVAETVRFDLGLISCELESAGVRRAMLKQVGGEALIQCLRKFLVHNQRCVVACLILLHLFASIFVEDAELGRVHHRLDEVL